MFNNYMLDVQFNIGIYIRLSQEDKDKKYETESESVINQRSVITDYIYINYLNKFNNYTIVGDYVDDGFSGTDFDRPKFKELIEDIKKKKINMFKLQHPQDLVSRLFILEYIKELGVDIIQPKLTEGEAHFW